MTATPPDPLATQHDGTPDPDGQGPADTRTQRLQEENRALRELLAAQVHASLPRQDPGWFRRLGCWLISAPGAALVGWRSLFGRDDGEPITRRSVGCAAVTVIYTLAIYGALVLLVVSWNSPNTATSGSTAASPVRVPLTPQPTQPPESDGPTSAPRRRRREAKRKRRLIPPRIGRRRMLPLPRQTGLRRTLLLPRRIRPRRLLQRRIRPRRLLQRRIRPTGLLRRRIMPPPRPLPPNRLAPQPPHHLPNTRPPVRSRRCASP